MRIPSLFKRGRNDDEEPTTLQTIVVLALVAMIGVILLVTLLRVGIQQWRPQPDTGPEVVQALDMPGSYQVEMQMIRHRDFGRATSEQHSLRTFALDLDSGKFMGTLIGIDEEPVRIGYDGKTFAKAEGATGQNWEEIDGDPLVADDITPPTKSMLAASEPAILTDEGTIRGQRAWVLGFSDPTPQMISQLMSAAYIEQQSSLGDEAREKEIEAVKEGKYKVKWAHAWVEYKSRRLIAMDVRWDVEDGAGYQTLVQWNNIGTNTLEAFNFEAEQEAL